MVKKFLLIIVLLSAGIYAQETDSVYIRTAQPETDSLHATADTAGIIPDTTLAAMQDSAKVKIDSLVPIYKQTLIDSAIYSYGVSGNDLEMSDYRNAADWFSYLPNAQYRDPGYLGQPAEVLLYGAGWGETGYYRDGILINNRLNNSYFTSEFLSESVDSLEFAPLPRGFLYGTMNNSAAVNFITKDFISKQPYTRIRFYQASNEEAFIDAQFNAYVHQRVNVFAEVENNTIDPYFDNSDFGQWKAEARIKYLASNSINIIGRYNYLKSNTELFGGINSQSLLNADLGNSDILKSATVNYPNRYQKNTEYSYTLSVLMRHAESLNGELSGYYISRLNEYRNNERNTAVSERVTRDNKVYTGGVSLKENLQTRYLRMKFQAAYESSKFEIPALTVENKTNTLSLSGELGTNMFGKAIEPSVYAKMLQLEGDAYIGMGADITGNISNSVKLYAGASMFQKPLDEFERKLSGLDFSPSDRNNINLQAGAGYYSESLSAGASVYLREINNNLIPAFRNDTLKGFASINKEAITGINLNFKIKLWQIFLEASANLYSSDNNNSMLPDYNGYGSLYYRDILFSNNLDLKAGINCAFSLEQKYFYYNYEYGRASNLTMNDSGSLEFIDPSYYYYDKNAAKLDLFMIGRIQQRAILYFIYENLTGQTIFVVPEFPIQGGGIRLGFAWELYN